MPFVKIEQFDREIFYLIETNGCLKQFQYFASGCGLVGRPVASNSRGPRFESSHRQKFILNILLSTGLKRGK